MEIMKRVPKSTLTLLALPEDARPNLRNAVEASLGGGGGAHTRLYFAEYLTRSEHLVRASMATVFLDTLLVNAHTTAMDVVWAGLPLVTTADTRFASRVAASILVAAKCAHTLARSQRDYVDVAVRLASSSSAGAQVRHCLSQARAAATRAAASQARREEHGAGGDSGRALFDTEQWVRGLERLLGNLWDLHAGGGGGGGGGAVHARARTQAFHVVSAA